MCYVACNQKWLAHHRGPLVDAYPNQIPPRKYLSHKVAQTLKLPYTCAEAFIKFKQLLERCKPEWDIFSKDHDEQMELCKEILQLGCYVLPGEVIASQKFENFLPICLKKELMLSLINIRRGNEAVGKSTILKTLNSGRTYKKPCTEFHSLLNVYAKISGEYLPYSLYKLNKTTAFVFTKPIDKPVQSVKLHAKTGNVDLFMVCRYILLNHIIQKSLVQLSNSNHTDHVPKSIHADEFHQRKSADCKRFWTKENCPNSKIQDLETGQ